MNPRPRQRGWLPVSVPRDPVDHYNGFPYRPYPDYTPVIPLDCVAWFEKGIWPSIDDLDPPLSPYTMQPHDEYEDWRRDGPGDPFTWNVHTHGPRDLRYCLQWRGPNRLPKGKDERRSP